MSQLPTNRTTAVAASTHVNDHNELHRLHNLLDTQVFTAWPGAELARAQSATLSQTSLAALTDIPGLMIEVDATAFAVVVRLHIAYLSMLTGAVGALVGLAIAVNGSAVEDTSVGAPVATAHSHGSVDVEYLIPAGTGVVTVTGQFLVTAGTAYVANDSATRSSLVARRAA